MRISLFILLSLFSTFALASELVGTNFSSLTEFYQNLEELEGWELESVRQIPIQLNASGKTKDFVIQSRDTCGIGICPSYLISEADGKIRILAYLGAAPKLKDSTHHGFYDLLTTQRSGHAKLFEQIQTHHKFNGKIYEVTEP